MLFAAVFFGGALVADDFALFVAEDFVVFAALFAGLVFGVFFALAAAIGSLQLDGQMRSIGFAG
jgi:hypothetical protein